MKKKNRHTILWNRFALWFCEQNQGKVTKNNQRSTYVFTKIGIFNWKNLAMEIECVKYFLLCSKTMT